MTPASGVMASLQRLRRRGASWLRDNEGATLQLVAAITLVGLVLRIAFLGDRVAHYDEGRVAYWAWHFGDTGSFAYRYIIHGPLLQHVDRWLFALLGANDFTMRLPVAVVGGLLPLTALLFRRHLRQVEIVALSLLFALNPLLLYYSRFMRSDMLVAAFMFTAFGLLVRLYDTRRPRYLYAAGFFLALGFASKENALVYVVTWLGATGLLLAKVFLLPGGFRSMARFLRGVPSTDEIRDRIVAGAKADWALLKRVFGGFRARHETAWLVASKYAFHILLALLLFEIVSLFFYAPRGAGVAGIEHPPVAATAPGYVGFWEGVTNPSLFGDLLFTTVDRIGDQWGEWLNPASEKELEDYRDALGVFLRAMGLGAGALSAFAAVGYVLDRWGYTPPRHLVPFCFYAGFVSIFGYPLGTDIPNAWIVTHAVVPLAVPGAVGLTALFQRGTTAVSEADRDMTIAVALVLLVATGFVGNAAATMVYTNTTDDDNALVQFAQPSQELRGELDEMRTVAAEHDTGPDVVVYYGQSGESFDDNNAYVGPDRGSWGDSWWNTQPTCMMWYNSLPMAWYFAAGDVDVACENDQLNLGTRVTEAKPPIIITQNFDTTVPQARLETAGYEGESYMLRTSGDRNRFTVWRYNESADSSTVRSRAGS